MNRLRSAWRLVRGLSSSRTGRATGCLYLLLSGVQLFVSMGWVDPAGEVDLRLWINGHIFDVPKFNLWWVVSTLGSVVAGWGLYGRAVAAGPLIVRPGVTLSPAEQVTQESVITEEGEAGDRPPPAVLGPPAGAGLGRTFFREG